VRICCTVAIPHERIKKVNNKMNKRKIGFSMFVLLLLPLFAFNGQAVTSNNPQVSGYYTSTVSQAYGIEASTNVTVTNEIAMDGYTFTADDKAPSALQAGVARTFSDSYSGSFFSSVSTEEGMWQTLSIVKESSMTQYSLKRDELGIETFYTLEDVYTVVNRAMQSYGKTANDLVVEQIYAEIVLDKTSIDNFFADTQTDQIQNVAENYATDTTKVATVLDPVFDDYIYDLCFAPVNVSTYATGWTIAEEVENVFTNSSDSSLDGATKLGSIRNALYGYLGAVYLPSVAQSPKVAVEPSQPSADEGSRFFGFEVRADNTYILKFNLLGDLVSNSKIIQNFGLALAQIFPSTMVLNQQAFPFWVHLLVSAIIATVVAGVYLLIAQIKSKKEKKKTFLKVWLIAFGICMLIMVISFPMLLSFTA